MILPAGALLLCATSIADVGVEIPPGTKLSIRLTSAIPGHANPGLALAAVLIDAVTQGGQVVLPAGRILHSTVKAAGELPPEHQRLYLQLEFAEIVTAAGARPIKARVVGVDNARETVDAEGRILGRDWGRARPTEIEGLLLLAADAYPLVLGAAEAGELGVREADRVPIEYGPGTEMTITLLQGLRLDAEPRASEPPDLSRDADLVRLASELPTRTEAAKLKRPSDLTNVLLVGTRTELADAFREAGWAAALPLGFETGAKAFLALAESHGYSAAPVSLLELAGAPPDLVFEKTNNTMAKRHHVRIWSRKGSFRARRLWLAAATHDIGIVLDRRDKTFTHRIDGRIDDERDKLMADLEFTGRVQARGLLGRPTVPRLTQNGTGDSVETDGRLGVLVLEETPAIGVQTADHRRLQSPWFDPEESLVSSMVVISVLLSLAAGASSPRTEVLTIRGQEQSLRVYGSRGGPVAVVASGDGGWIHLGPYVAELLASKGYFVVGFDCKAYLSSFTKGGTTLGTTDVPGDFAALAEYASQGSNAPPILFGISEGAALAVLAGTNDATRAKLAGVVALGLPDQAELGWRFRDSVIYVTKGVPKEPLFSTAAVIDKVAPLPLVAIHSTKDEFVSVDDVKRVMSRAREPKQLWLIEADDHKFSGKEQELNQKLLDAIAWIRAPRR